jgi:ApaG protein
MNIPYTWAPVNPLRAVSEACTQGIRVRVESFYVADRSAPALNAYFFAYRIRITNEGDEWAALRSRHWIITDGNGLTSEVEGEGVVGETPELEPGESFEYTSACPLSTRVGFMRGSYTIARRNGATFRAKIAEFALLAPGTEN